LFFGALNGDDGTNGGGGVWSSSLSELLINNEDCGIPNGGGIGLLFGIGGRTGSLDCGFAAGFALALAFPLVNLPFLAFLVDVAGAVGFMKGGGGLCSSESSDGAGTNGGGGVSICSELSEFSSRNDFPNGGGFIGLLNPGVDAGGVNELVLRLALDDDVKVLENEFCAVPNEFSCSSVSGLAANGGTYVFDERNGGGFPIGVVGWFDGSGI